jgi:hypothetical protein
LRKLAIILAASLMAGGGLWMALRPHGVLQELQPPRLSQEEMRRAQAEVEDSIKCGHDYRAGSSAYVQCMEQLNVARTQGPPQSQLDTKGTQLPDTVTSAVARVGAAMVMLIMSVIMMLVFCGFWALGAWIGLDEMRR